MNGNRYEELCLRHGKVTGYYRATDNPRSFANAQDDSVGANAQKLLLSQQPFCYYFA